MDSFKLTPHLISRDAHAYLRQGQVSLGRKEVDGRQTTKNGHRLVVTSHARLWGGVGRRCDAPSA
jgi:hypothetical protein